MRKEVRKGGGSNGNGERKRWKAKKRNYAEEILKGQGKINVRKMIEINGNK